MINLVAIFTLGHDVKVYFNFRHHFISHMGVVVAVHHYEVVNSRHVVIDEGPSNKFSPLSVNRDYNIKLFNGQISLLLTSKAL